MTEAEKRALELIENEQFFRERPASTLVYTPALVGFKRLTEGAVIPIKAHATDSGFDLVASDDVIIEPGDTKVVPTGIAVSLPKGYEAQVRPRSGVTSRTKLRVQLGTIDNGYTGAIGVILDNIAEDSCGNVMQYVTGVDGNGVRTEHETFPNDTYLVRKGDKIAQLVVAPVYLGASYEITDGLSGERGANGFGSTGI